MLNYVSWLSKADLLVSTTTGQNEFAPFVTQRSSPPSEIVLDPIGELSTRLNGHFCCFRYLKFHGRGHLLHTHIQSNDAYPIECRWCV